MSEPVVSAAVSKRCSSLLFTVTINYWLQHYTRLQEGAVPRTDDREGLLAESLRVPLLAKHPIVNQRLLHMLAIDRPAFPLAVSKFVCVKWNSCMSSEVKCWWGE